MVDWTAADIYVLTECFLPEALACGGQVVAPNALGVFAPLVRALVFKTSGRLEKSRQWVRFPYTPVADGGRAVGLVSPCDVIYHRGESHHWLEKEQRGPVIQAGERLSLSARTEFLSATRHRACQGE